MSQNLLEVVHDLFEEQTSLEKVILKTMQRGQRLLKCQRAAVLLLDDTTDTVKFAKLFELSSPANGHSIHSSTSSKEQVYTGQHPLDNSKTITPMYTDS